MPLTSQIAVPSQRSPASKRMCVFGPDLPESKDWPCWDSRMPLTVPWFNLHRFLSLRDHGVYCVRNHMRFLYRLFNFPIKARFTHIFNLCSCSVWVFLSLLGELSRHMVLCNYSFYRFQLLSFYLKFGSTVYNKIMSVSLLHPLSVMWRSFRTRNVYLCGYSSYWCSNYSFYSFLTITFYSFVTIVFYLQPKFLRVVLKFPV